MDPIQQLREGLRNLVISALEKSRQEGLLGYDTLPAFPTELPRDQAHGAFASDAAFFMSFRNVVKSRSTSLKPSAEAVENLRWSAI